MTVTDELRRMLDDRGIQWRKVCEDTEWEQTTEWADANGWECAATVGMDTGPDHVRLHMYATPSQAIAATLGRGTCTMAHEDGNDTWWSCNECDADVYLPTKPKFCWNCGREVVDG